MSSDSGPTGQKFDSGKTLWSLLPWKSVEPIVRVLMHGAAKYQPFNWQLVPNPNKRYFDATLRHLFAWWEGEPIDEESGFPHLAHAGCNIIFLIWFSQNGVPDDRERISEPTNEVS